MARGCRPRGRGDFSIQSPGAELGPRSEQGPESPAGAELGGSVPGSSPGVPAACRTSRASERSPGGDKQEDEGQEGSTLPCRGWEASARSPAPNPCWNNTWRGRERSNPAAPASPLEAVPPPAPKITPRHVGPRRHPPGAFWSVVPGKAAPGGAEGIFSTSRRRSAAASGERSQHPADSQLLSAGPAARGWLPPLSPTSPSPRGPTQGVVLHPHKGPGLVPRAAPQPPAVPALAAPQEVKPPGTCSPSAHPTTPPWSFWGENGEKHAAVALPSTWGNSCHQDVAWPRHSQRGHGAGRGDVTPGMPPAPVPRPPQAHRPRRGSHSPPPPVSTGTVFNKQRGIF